MADADASRHDPHEPNPSKTSRSAQLDGLNVFLADVRDGMGPFLGTFLREKHHWDAGRVYRAGGGTDRNGTGSDAGRCLIDGIRWKRLAVAIAAAVVAAGCVVATGRCSSSSPAWRPPAPSPSACIIAAQVVMVPAALAASRRAASWGRKPVFLIGFTVLPVGGMLYCLGVNPYYLVGVQLLDGIGAGIFGVVSVLVVADLTKGTGRFNLTQGALATATGIGDGMSNVLAGFVVKAAGFDAGFLTLAAIAAAASIFYALAMPETRGSRGVVAESPSVHMMAA